MEKKGEGINIKKFQKNIEAQKQEDGNNVENLLEKPGCFALIAKIRNFFKSHPLETDTTKTNKEQLYEATTNLQELNKNIQEEQNITEEAAWDIIKSDQKYKYPYENYQYWLKKCKNEDESNDR